MSIVADCSPRFAIAEGVHREWLTGQAQAPGVSAASFEGVEWISCKHLEESGSEAWRPALWEAHAPCLLQYTSGSTSAPKGVALTQENFVANVDTAMARIGLRADDCNVCWLPPFHDMGLVSGILGPLCHGIPTVLLSPIAFQRRPMKWLETMARFGGTISGGPNFGYDLCVRRLAPPEKLAALDLSRWRVAFSGAERIRVETFERFASALQPTGFNATALTPCYGLAESTVGVTFARPGSGWHALELDEASLAQGKVLPALPGQTPVRLMGCGEPLPDCELRIVDPRTLQPVEPGHIGEIWVRSASVGAGYWGQPDVSRQVFRASPAGEPGTQSDFFSGDYLRTGDLGFLHEGELFVAGRIKDLVILRGANHFPEDIESSMSRVLPPQAAGSCAAFSLERNGQEALVVVQELELARRVDGPALEAQIRDVIAERHEIQVDDVVFVASGEIPRTSSGKIQRGACREQYRAGQLKRVVEPAPLKINVDAAEDEVGRVASIMTALLDLTDMGADDDFFWLGGHSLLATQLVSRLRQSFQVDVTLRHVFEGATPRKLAALMATLPRIPEPAPIVRSAPGTPQVLSFSQERMWLVHQLEPQSAAYNVGGGLLFEGPLDVAALKRALQCVTRRHEVLRASFPSADGSPTMVVAATVQVELPVMDVSNLADPMGSAMQAAEALMHEPFDVAQGPLMRFVLWRLGPDRHLLGASLHHLITDAWSIGLLIRDTLDFYDAEAAGQEPTVTATPYAYGDFARWQREQMSGERLDREIDWWTRRLEGASPLEIPTDYPRAARRTSDGTYLPVELPPGLLDALGSLGTAHGTTLFMVLLAAFDLLLARYSGSDDLVVGIPVANRNGLASESLMGSLVNTLALRVKVDPAQSFLTLLGHVREVAIDAYTHQDLPFERLVTSMRMERRPGESPLVNVMFDFQNAPVPGRATGPMRVKPVHLSRGGAQFDLNLLVMDTELGRLAGIEYRTELFDEATMRRLLRHYVRVLEQVIADPALPLEQFSLVDEAEREEQLALSVSHAPAAAAMAGVCEAIAACARQQPDATALVDDLGSVSYAELEARACLLAHRLVERGAGPGERVGVLLERGRDLVVALLATLKTGAAYVPLDPRFPADRISYVVEDACPRVLVTRSPWRHLAQSQADEQCLLLDNEALDGGHAGHSTQTLPALPALLTGDRTAYVIYTSGSTGRPKGVAVGMAALANFLGSMAHTPGLVAQDRVLALTTVAFDIAGLEIWLPLTQGASVRIVTEETATDPLALMQCMESWRPTLMQATPATWKMLLAARWAGDPALKILCGGEAMPPDLAQALLPRCSSLWNMYGPTETTIWSTLHRVRPEDQGRIPIGFPIDRTRIYVVDRLGNLQPRGVTGELVIGGTGVAQGYYNRPELTAERFVADPFAAEPGARMYRTGDGARLRSDGRFECLARMDDQIKLRGFRIEPGEIEAVLKEDPAVRDAVVVASGRDADEARLVGYYVAAADVDDLQARLYAGLEHKLPDYMVPSVLVRLDSLPQTPNGKVDRRALPTPDFGALVRQDDYVAPTDDVERELVALWEELLEIPRVGTRDNFFRIGGHSLLAMRVLARIRQRFDVTLAPAVLIERPTIGQLAQEIRAAGVKESPAAVDSVASVPAEGAAYRYLVPFGSATARTQLVCVHGAGGNVLNFAALSERLGRDRRLLGVQARGVDGRDGPFGRIEDMAQAYLQELRRIQPRGPYFLAGYCGGGIVAQAMATRLRDEGEQVPLLVLIDCYRPGVPLGRPSRAVQWTAGVRRQGLKFVLAGAKRWLLRNGRFVQASMKIATYRAFGQVIPFELRDFWLTRNFDRSARHHRIEPYAGELTVFRAAGVQADLNTVGPDLGWKGLANSVRTYDVPGDHSSLLDSPNVDVLALRLAQCLDRAEGLVRKPDGEAPRP